MNTFSSTADAQQPAAPAPSSTLKWLWGAVGALTLAVLALGGTLIAQQHKAASQEQEQQAEVAARTPESEVIEEKAPQTQNQPAQQAPETLAAQTAAGAAPARPARPHAVAPRAGTTATTTAPAAAPQPVAQAPQPVPPVAPVCAVCGRVESVRAIQKSAPTSGVGAVAGGVLGGVLGNQVGGGTGRALATVAGAVGGGYLGNTIEKRSRTETVYEVRVRMDDGSVRYFQRAQSVPVGAPVVLEGRGFRLVGNEPAPAPQYPQ
ncbi:MAG: glycine zipper 2TM domain-containing protein [Burkholderiaceae bacterium]|jgi:outer membrane lipoprotein SlyB|nr:glycine zipper 2TM domain-containing protein [Burkholderiaceae bacterium]